MKRNVCRATVTGLLGLALAVSSLGSLGCQARPEESSSPGTSTPAADPNALHLLFTYGSEKEEWIKEMTARFNAGGHRTASGKVIQVEAVPQGSGELIDDLLAGARQAHLTSPASAAFIKLGNAQSRVRKGKNLIGETKNLVLSPVVIAMWRPMAEAIGWGRRPVGWSDVLALARDPAGWASHSHPEWGAFKLGHTHPEYSNSGLISLLAEAYAGAGKVAGLSLEDLQRPETASYVAGIESAVVHYGSSTGFFGKRMFEGGPEYLSAAVLYENMVIESYGPQYQKPFPVVAIYPKEGTFWSDHPVGLVEREWVTPEHEEAARVYVDYLLARPQQEAALRYGFRPSAVEVALGAPFDAAHGVDPREPQTTLEVPPVEVIDGALKLWRENKKLPISPSSSTARAACARRGGWRTRGRAPSSSSSSSTAKTPSPSSPSTPNRPGSWRGRSSAIPGPRSCRRWAASSRMAAPPSTMPSPSPTPASSKRSAAIRGRSRPSSC